MRDKYRQWLKEKEKAVFRSMRNTNKWHDVKDQGFQDVEVYIFLKCQVPSDFHKDNCL